MPQKIVFDLMRINIERNRAGKMSIPKIIAKRIVKEYLLTLKPAPPPTNEELDQSWPNQTGIPLP